VECRVSGSPDEVRAAEKIIFPGVGSARSAMRYLNETGLSAAIVEAAAKGTPMLGICLGTQIIMTKSEEGGVECLGIIDGVVRQFVSPDPSLKIPHMGWNSISLKTNERPQHPVLAGMNDGDEFYFVHSYYVVPDDEGVVAAACEYIVNFPAIVARDNIVAAQFHPEKSGQAGLSMLAAFARWKGEFSC
jgi:glutamine amidotransferase